jgi:hypothetical protein
MAFYRIYYWQAPAWKSYLIVSDKMAAQGLSETRLSSRPAGVEKPGLAKGRVIL